MNAEEWKTRRELRLRFQEPKGRGVCTTCLRPPLTCYCALVKPFDPKILFAILIHGREAQKKVATGRLSHQILANSCLIQGSDYSGNERVNQLIQDPGNHCVVLYPGENSLNLSAFTAAQREDLFPPKKLVVFVIDGTWHTARKTMQESQNLKILPKISFSPTRPSNFRVRRQPQENFFSTLEAIHETIELLGPGQGFELESRRHDSLLGVFDHIVNQQIELARAPKKHCLWWPGKKA